MKKYYTLVSSLLLLFFLIATISVKAVEKSGSVPAQKSNVNIHSVNKLTFRERVKIIKEIKKESKKAGVRKGGTPKVILYILAIILPPVAVGIYTNWGEPTLWNLLFTILFWIPGVVHAFYILLK